MNPPKEILTAEEVNDANTGWSLRDNTITAAFETGDFATGLKLVNLIGDSAEEHNHHPDIVLTYPTVEVTLSSHDVGGLTERDITLARLINAHASNLGVEKTT